MQFFKESKAKAEKAKALLASQTLEINQRQSSIALKYEENKDDQQVRKIVAVKRSENDNNDGFVSRDQILGEINTATTTQPNSSYSHTNEEKRNHDFVAPSFASIYSKNQHSSSLPSHPSSVHEKNSPKSTWSGLAKKPSADNSSQLGKRVVSKQSSELSSKKANDAKLQAKRFFDEAKQTLDKDDLVEVQRLVIAMKNHGAAKNSTKYIETTRDLINLLANNSAKLGDGKCIRLIRLLFPLLPVKYRYKSEQIAANTCFEKSALRKQCKEDVLQEKDFSLVKKLVLSMIFDQQASYNSMIDASNDRILLEDSQKVLTILTSKDINIQLFFDLLPDRHLRKVKSLAMEMKKSRAVADAKKRSANVKGEDCVNTALFRRNTDATSVRVPKKLEALEDKDAEKNLTEALKQGALFNRDNMDRIKQNQAEKQKIPFNPYAMKPLKKESVKRNLPLTSAGAAKKRPFHGTDSSSTNDVLRVLDKVKADGFVQQKTKTDRINGKINANVPKSFSCMICYNYPEEVRLYCFTLVFTSTSLLEPISQTNSFPSCISFCSRHWQIAVTQHV